LSQLLAAALLFFFDVRTNAKVVSRDQERADNQGEGQMARGRYVSRPRFWRHPFKLIGPLEGSKAPRLQFQLFPAASAAVFF